MQAFRKSIKSILSVMQSKRKIFLSTFPSVKHYIKFGCPKPKSSCPKSFARFLSQMELMKTNELKWPQYGKVKSDFYYYFVKYEVCYYYYKINFNSTVI